MTIETKAHARAGLCGNPSDGYFGKTLSFIIRDFATTVRLTESAHLEIIQNEADHRAYGSVNDLLRDVSLYGYYGGERLIKCAIKRFAGYAQETGQGLHGRNFTITYESNVPRLVGLSGSSAIVVATMKALMAFYGVQIPKHYLPTLVLSVETELKITAGLQDRVIQTYEGMVYMDFEREHLTQKGYGIYEELQRAEMKGGLPPLYISYDPNRAEISDVAHRNLRELFEKGDPTVVAAMEKYREITTRAKNALMAGDWAALAAASNEGFDLRTTFMNIAPENLRMITTARDTGASAAFAGSGGAVVGLYEEEAGYARLKEAMGGIGCTTFKPTVF